MATSDILMHGARMGGETGVEKAIEAKTIADEAKSSAESATADIANREPKITPSSPSNYFRGDKTWRNLATDVLDTVLTGLSILASESVVPTDSILVAIGKLQAQVNDGLEYIESSISFERTATATLTNKTLIEPFIKNYTEVMYGPNTGINVSGAIDVDLSNGTLQKFILTGNTTFNLPASVPGKSFTLEIGYNGAFVPSFSGGTSLKWANQAAPAAKSVAGFYDLYCFTQDGAVTLGRSGGGNF